MRSKFCILITFSAVQKYGDALPKPCVQHLANIKQECLCYPPQIIFRFLFAPKKQLKRDAKLLEISRWHNIDGVQSIIAVRQQK